MKILHIVPTYLPAIRYGGVTNAVHSLCRSLSKLNHDIHIFTTSVNGPEDSKVPLGQPVNLEGVKVWYFSSKNFRRLYFSPALSTELLRQIADFDIIHLHSIYLWPTYIAARTAHRAGIAYVISPHGMLVKRLVEKKNRWIKSTWIELIEKYNFKHASAILFTSNYEKEEARKFGLQFPPTFVVPNGVDLEEINSRQEDEVLKLEKQLYDRPFLLFLGRINWEKGLDRLIPAMSHVLDIDLIIAGNDEGNYKPVLEKLAEKFEVRHRISFVGPVYGSEKANLVKSTTALVLPSYSENFGIVVLEAMAAGCPVVVTPEVGLSETVQESGAGIVAKGDPEVLGKSIQELISNPNRLRQMSEAGKKIVRERFTWGIVAEQMESAYKEILDRTKHDSSKR